MNIEDLSKEELLIVVDQLQNGDTLEDVLAQLVPKSIQVLAYKAHILLCTQEHGPDDGQCHFHSDDALPNKWKTDSHSEWVTYIFDLMLKTKSNENALFNAFRFVSEIMMDLEHISFDERPIILEILKNYITRNLPQ